MFENELFGWFKRDMKISYKNDNKLNIWEKYKFCMYSIVICIREILWEFRVVLECIFFFDYVLYVFVYLIVFKVYF